MFKIAPDDSDNGGHNQFKSSATASDLLLEVDFKEPILQIASGLLLASNNIQLAVLHPTKFCVYSISGRKYLFFHALTRLYFF